MKYIQVYPLFLMLVFCTSCGGQNQSQSKKENQIVQTKTDSKLLKYTSGVRSILEDSKGNIWFGSYNEGVCLLHNGELQYFTIENGLSNNQVRSIYDDKKMTIYNERNYDSKNRWKLTDSDLWFKGDETAGYNKLEGDPGVY